VSFDLSKQANDCLYLFSDMSPQQDVFNGAIELFASDQEDVRAAAAFAAGQSFIVFLISIAYSHRITAR
jgi:hypothetical protein